MKKYKIGEFAKIVGVTPDFIKHYENYGLLKPEISDSGYRYYDFKDAIYFFEFFKYKKWGYSIKEMMEVMQKDSIEEHMKSLLKQSEVVKKNMCIEDMMLVDCKGNQERFVEHLNEWYIMPKFKGYYIHHSTNEEIVDDFESNTMLKNMLDCFPITKECVVATVDDNGNLDENEYWGFFMPEMIFGWFGFEPNEKTHLVLDGRYFEMNACFELDEKKDDNSFNHNFEEVLQLMKQYHLQPKGYMTFQIHVDLVQEGKHFQYGVVRVPIQ